MKKKLEKPGNLKEKSIKNLDFLTIFTCLVEKFQFDTKNCPKDKFVNMFKVALQYFFNVFILFNTVFNLQLKFKLKIDPKMCTFRTWEKFGKPKKNLAALLKLV